MPAPQPQNKFTEQLENNIYLRTKMREAFIQACRTLSEGPLGALEDFELKIDNVLIRYKRDDQIFLNDTPYDSCTPYLRKQGYDRLEKFMQIAMVRYNNQYNL